MHYQGSFVSSIAFKCLLKIVRRAAREVPVLTADLKGETRERARPCVNPTMFSSKPLFHSALNSQVISSTCLPMVSGRRRRIKRANDAVEAANRRKTYAPSRSCKVGKV